MREGIGGNEYKPDGIDKNRKKAGDRPPAAKANGVEENLF